MSPDKSIFFHVGLGKTGSTFLQQSVFPHLEGIHYIKPSRYKRSKEIIASTSSGAYLVSREFDKQLEEELCWFCEDLDNVRVIMCLRRQDDWIASQYKRRVKNGWIMEFSEFINLVNDEGYWKQAELCFFPKIELIKRITGHDPLVLLFDELKAMPEKLIERICLFTGSKMTQTISYSPKHTSFSDKQLIVLQWFCRRIIKTVPRGRNNRLLHWLLYRPVWAMYHVVLYLAYLIPVKWLRKKRLIDRNELEAVQKFFEKDWVECGKYRDQLT